MKTTMKSIISTIFIVLLLLSIISFSTIQFIQASPDEETQDPTNTYLVAGKWLTPTSAYTSNDDYASALQHGSWQGYYDYDFDSVLPADIFISKVQVGLEFYCEAGESLRVRISVDGGTNWSFWSSSFTLTTEDTLWLDVTAYKEPWIRDYLLDANWRVEVNFLTSGGASCYPDNMYFAVTENISATLLDIQDWEFYNPTQIQNFLEQNKTIYILTWGETGGWFIDERSQAIRVDEHDEGNYTLYDVYSGELDINYTDEDGKDKMLKWRSHIELTDNHNMTYFLNGEWVNATAQDLFNQWENGETVYINHLWYNYTSKSFPVTDIKVTKKFKDKVYNVLTKGEWESGNGTIIKGGKTLTEQEYDMLLELKRCGVPIGKFPPFLAVLEKGAWTAYLDWIPTRVTHFTGNFTATYYYHTGCETFYVDSVSKENGTVESYSVGTVLNITSVASSGYEFYNYTYDSSETTDNPWSLTLNNNYTIHAYFLQYTIYNASSKHLLGSTTQLSGTFPEDLEANDQSYKVFRSYESTIGSDIIDYVDNNSSDIDSSADLGSHSNFTAQQYAPDLINDTLTEENTGSSGDTIIEEHWVDGFTGANTDWTEVGDSPYLNTIDYSTNYIWESAVDTHYEGLFGFGDTSGSGTVNTIKICTYATQDSGDNGEIEVFVYNAVPTLKFQQQFIPTAGSWGWTNFTVGTVSTFDEFNDLQLKVRAEREGGEDILYIDASLLYISYTEPDPNYEIDLEVQWTSADNNEENEYLCVYGGTQGAEALTVDVYYSSSWTNIIADLSAGWNNVSISSYLDASTFTIRFKGDIESSDTTQHTWEIDSTLIHVWNVSEYTMEVEFDGQSDDNNWVWLRWSVDSALTNASVSVILQLYNYTASAYAPSGDGYMSYTSSGTPNTDELKIQTITDSPTDFRNGTYYWWVKVTAIKVTADQFDWKGDWIEFRVFTYPTVLISVTNIIAVALIVAGVLSACGFFIIPFALRRRRRW